MKHSTVQYSTVHTVQYIQYSTYSTVHCSAVQYSTVHTVQYSTIQYIQYSTVQCSAVQYIQYSTVQYSTVQYSTVQYSTVQCSTVEDLYFAQHEICFISLHILSHYFISYITITQLNLYHSTVHVRTYVPNLRVAMVSLALLLSMLPHTTTLVLQLPPRPDTQ